MAQSVRAVIQYVQLVACELYLKNRERRVIFSQFDKPFDSAAFFRQSLRCVCKAPYSFLRFLEIHRVDRGAQTVRIVSTSPFEN